MEEGKNQTFEKQLHINDKIPRNNNLVANNNKTKLYSHSNPTISNPLIRKEDQLAYLE